VNPTLFDYSETTTDWLQHLYRNLGIFQGELRAKVLASIVYELARRRNLTLVGAEKVIAGNCWLKCVFCVFRLVLGRSRL